MQCEGFRWNRGDVLWIEPCRSDRPDEQLFRWQPVTGRWGQLRTAFKNLCLERRGSRNVYKLEDCDSSNNLQWFQGLNPTKTFELYPRPIEQNGEEEEDSLCMNMDHHPRQFEEITHTSCSAARWDATSLWHTRRNNDGDRFQPEKYYRIGAQRTDPFPPCSSTFKCGMCQGDCDSDSQCTGELRCFQRGSGNPTKTPPGCYGEGVPSKYSSL